MQLFCPIRVFLFHFSPFLDTVININAICNSLVITPNKNVTLDYVCTVNKFVRVSPNIN